MEVPILYLISGIRYVWSTIYSIYPIQSIDTIGVVDGIPCKGIVNGIPDLELPIPMILLNGLYRYIQDPVQVS